MSLEEPAVEGHHDAGQPAHDGGSILQEPSRVLLHQRPHVERSFMSESLAVEAASTGSCCCSCKSAISVGEARWSGALELPQCRTAPLHCPVPPDSSSPLSAGASRQLRYTVSWLVTLLLPILLASASFCRGVGMGS